MSAVAFMMVLQGTNHLVTRIRAHRSDLNQAIQIYTSEERALLELSPSDIIPGLLRIVDEMQIWTHVCVGVLLLGRACVEWNMDSQVRNQAMQAILTAYEPPQHVDNGTTQIVKMLSLSALGFEPARISLHQVAAHEGIDDRRCAGKLFGLAIQTIADSSEQ